MMKIKKYIAIIGIQFVVVCIFYYIFIKLILRIQLIDALPLIIVGACAFITGVIYYLWKEKTNADAKLSSRKLLLLIVCIVLNLLLLLILASLL